MYIEHVTELAFDDITPEDPDFASIQGESTMSNFGYHIKNPDFESVSVVDFFIKV